MSQFPSRRQFIRLGATGAVLGAAAFAGDSVIFEPNHPVLKSIEVPLTRLTDPWDGFRIVQLSDLHYDDVFSVRPIRSAIDIVSQLEADLVVLTGDFVTGPVRHFRRPRSSRVLQEAARAIDPCAELLGQLRAPCGVLAIMGNHDVGTDPDYIAAALESHGIRVLDNRSIALERDGKRLWISGVDDILWGKPDLDLAMRGIPPDEPVILLAHEPDWADHVAKYPVDLQLSGHSHGGQVRFPLIGAPFLPELGRKYPWGFRQIGRLSLYTNVGVGTVRIPARIGCPPEVSLFTLRSAAGTQRIP